VGVHRLGVALSAPSALAVLAAVGLALALAGCGSANPPRGNAVPAALAAQSRPIGAGAGFHPRASGPVLGACRPGLGHRTGVHVEVFAQDRVVLLAAGIGARPPLRHSEGRITGASCFGSLVTLEPTGVVLTRPGTRLTVGDLFRSWGQPLSAREILSFRGPVRTYVGGHPRPGPASSVPLTRHAEIVLEVGPYVPPHPSYHFPPGT
jgi:hypothetical protein